MKKATKTLVVNIKTENTMEAMELENPTMLPVKDSVKEIVVSPGIIVNTGDKLAGIEY